MSLSIVIIDTEKAGGGVPTQTTFQLSPQFGGFQEPRLVLERGGHKPSPAESLAPFHQDPTQRIVALAILTSSANRVFVFRAQALLELPKGREGSEIKRDEWGSCVVIPSIDSDGWGYETAIWVSRCRLFCFRSTHSVQGTRVKLFDFSAEGRAKYLGARVGEVRYLSPTKADSGQVPYGARYLAKRTGAYCSHGSIVLVKVSAAKLNVLSNFGTRLHIWTSQWLRCVSLDPHNHKRDDNDLHGTNTGIRVGIELKCTENGIYRRGTWGKFTGRLIAVG